MEYEIIKQLAMNCHLDSTFLQCPDETFSNFYVRLYNDDKPLQFYFQKVLALKQYSIPSDDEGYALRELNDGWIDDFLHQNPTYGKGWNVEINASDYHHFTLLVGDIQFDILAMWCTEKSKFSEMYREQEAVKTLIV